MKKSTFLDFLTKNSAALASVLGVTALLTALPVQGDTGKTGEQLPGPIEEIIVTPEYSGIW